MTDNADKYVLHPEKNVLKAEYDSYIDVRHHITNDVRERVEHILVQLHSNPVISGRIKNFDSYFSKYLRLKKAGDENPIITDLLGVRIICPFIEDLSATEDLIKEEFKIVETERKGHYDFKEFGYESTHILIEIPKEIITERGDPGTNIMEIQIRTILQDAWAEVEHELVYKAEFSPFDEPMKRKLAAVNASLSLADIIFQEIRSYQRKYSKELEKRRESFFQKIEESTDALLFTEEQIKKSSVPVTGTAKGTVSTENDVSIDDLLVHALTAHNQNRFNEAINQYSKILELKPNLIICSIIYKHRGMANFACSQYKDAISDFTSALDLDPQAYKAAYYRGVVNSVLKEYAPAIDDYTLSLKLNPYQSFCLFRRAQAFYHIGDYPAALSDCENSLALEPGNTSANKFKELLLDKLKM
ncbi:MAG: tetratricopeptide repeat protein [Treponema sp.]|jgi:putative GTP pyrophosphokinase|nr:tetratricopeptide repeat protein [Treponema sp.]